MSILDAVPAPGEKPTLHRERQSFEAGLEPYKSASTEAVRSLQLVDPLLRISKSIRAIMTIKLAEIDIKPGQDQLLMQLDPSQPVSVGSLATSLSVRASTVSKMVDRLERKGLLHRLSDGTDHRRALVRTSAEGIRAQTAILRVWEELDAELARDLRADDVGTIAVSLKTIDKTLKARLDRLR